MPRYLSKEKIKRIKFLRSQGWSLPEIYKEVKVGYGTVSKYIKGVAIKPQFKDIWLNKRNGSRARMQVHNQLAYKKANDTVTTLNLKEKILILSALYWGEGGKKDLNFTNSDADMIKIFVTGLREVLNIKRENIRISLRIYEDLDKDLCLNYWSKITGIPSSEFVNIDILKGRKFGKLPYGLCRVRVLKGGDMLKYFLALNKRVSEVF